MDLTNTDDGPCIICLKNKGFFEWTEAVFEFSGPSYKDCYYLFTQLEEEILEDDLIQMFCLDCGDNLRNAYLLVDKALSVSDTHIDANQCRICLKNKVFFDGKEVIFEFYGPSYNECYYKYTQLQEEENDCNYMFCLNCGNGLRSIHQLVKQARTAYATLREIKPDVEIKYEIERVTSPELIEGELDNSLELEEHSDFSEIKILDNEKKTEPQNHSPENVLDSDSMYETDNNKSKDIKKSTKKPENKPKEKRRPLMCSYCSKIFYSRNHFTKHEETHKQRERTEACPICGLKFYNAIGVKNHLTVHDENRVRKYKCEYCSKAFYSCGGLNCHRRKHLDNWLQCKLCPKKYCREYELNRHMRTHDATPVTKDDLETRTKQKIMYKECETCGKKVNKYNWETHNAKHLNQPLVQCGICDESYFNRLTLCRHLQKDHNIEKSEFEKHIIKLNNKFKPRYSNLMKKQNIVID